MLDALVHNTKKTFISTICAKMIANTQGNSEDINVGGTHNVRINDPHMEIATKGAANQVPSITVLRYVRLTNNVHLFADVSPLRK